MNGLFTEAGYDGPMYSEPMRPWTHMGAERPAEETVRLVSECYDRIREAAKNPRW